MYPLHKNSQFFRSPSLSVVHISFFLITNFFVTFPYHQRLILLFLVQSRNTNTYPTSYFVLCLCQLRIIRLESAKPSNTTYTIIGYIFMDDFEDTDSNALVIANNFKICQEVVFRLFDKLISLVNSYLLLSSYK